MSQLDVVCDNSELTAIWGALTPDVIIVGGLALNRGALTNLCQQSRHIKQSYGVDPDCPVKWNLRDVDRALRLHGCEGDRSTLLSQSNALRKELIQAIAGSGATLFVSAILAYSNRRQVLGRTKRDLVRFSFGNLLMRLGLYCQESAHSDPVELILDWPESNNRKPFVDEYLDGWRHGRSGTKTQFTPYHCGCLEGLGFMPSPVFAPMDLDPRVQLADLVVGASRSIFEYALGKQRANSFGVQRFRELLPHFDRNASGRVMGRGITVSPTRSDFSGVVMTALNKLSP